MMKIPTTEERKRKARKRGGFSDSWLDKKHLKLLSNVHRCKWCHNHMKPYAFNHRTGELLMSCSTSGCMGNASLERNEWNKQHREIYARHIDRKLTFDMKHLMFGKNPARMWAVKNRIF